MNMTPNEAFKLAEMIIKTWPSGPKQAAWSEMLQRNCVGDPAWRTYTQLADTEERAPSLAGFLQVYRRNAGTNREHPNDYHPVDDGPTMSFNEYIARLTWRAGTGDTEATEMLEVWDANLKRMPERAWRMP